MDPNVARLIARVNSKFWWRTCLPSNYALRRRGLFLAATFADAEFYGKPLDTPFVARVSNPYVTDNDSMELDFRGFLDSGPPHGSWNRFYRWWSARDAAFRSIAVARGFDSIIVMSQIAFVAFRTTGKLPRKMELNIFHRRNWGHLGAERISATR